MSAPPRPWCSLALTVAHFNTLAELYQPNHLPEGRCRFEIRREKIRKELSWLNADVVSLNECNPSSWYRTAFADAAHGEYEMLFVSKSDRGTCSAGDMLTKVNDADDGAALLLRKRTVERLDAIHLTCTDPAGNQARQSAIAALCWHRPSNKPFIVATMHMKANGYDPVTKTNTSECPRRLHQGEQILRKLAEYRRTNAAASNAPVIFAGDFNAGPDSLTMRLLLAGSATAGELTYHNTWFQFDDAHHLSQAAWRKPFESGAEGEEGAPQRKGPAVDRFTILDSSYNPTGDPFVATLDYILLERNRFLLTGFVAPAGQPDQWGKDAIPHTGSDHLPLGVSMMLL